MVVVVPHYFVKATCPFEFLADLPEHFTHDLLLHSVIVSFFRLKFISSSVLHADGAVVLLAG